MILDFSTLSKYRTELMGLGTLLILICHMPASVPEMPQSVGYVLSIGNIGVDFFLFISGFGIYHSLSKSDQSMKAWYGRRFKRILVPYLLISVPFYVFKDWSFGIERMLLDISTISFWTEHQGAWFIALLLPLYLIAPFIKEKCQPIWKGMTICLALAIMALILSLFSNNPHNMVANISFALMRVPSFVLGMMMAPLILNDGKKKINPLKALMLAFIPVVLIGVGKVLLHDLYLMWLAIPLLLYVACLGLQKLPKSLVWVMKWGGLISLESYLLNIYNAQLLVGVDLGFSNYLKYGLMVVFDIILALLVWKIGQVIINSNFSFIKISK